MITSSPTTPPVTAPTNFSVSSLDLDAPIENRIYQDMNNADHFLFKSRPKIKIGVDWCQQVELEDSVIFSDYSIFSTFL